MSDDEWRARYLAHLSSDAWRELKDQVIAERGEYCQRCGADPPLHLHHNTYERLGHELLSDVELVCPDCHPIADEERAERGRKRSAVAQYEAALNTYASKKYGEHWYESSYSDEIEDEFDEWLEGKEPSW